MSREIRLYLEDILEAISYLRMFTKGITFNEFHNDVRTQHACVRNLEVIGEAARHVPEEMRVKHGEVEWRKIAGLRNILAHEYFGIDIEIVWDILDNKLDSLDSTVRFMLTQVSFDQDDKADP